MIEYTIMILLFLAVEFPCHRCTIQWVECEGNFFSFLILFKKILKDVHQVTVLCRSLEDQVRSSVQKVQELEAYLGGEIPDLDTGKTWREERQLLGCHVEVRIENDKKEF